MKMTLTLIAETQDKHGMKRETTTKLGKFRVEDRDAELKEMKRGIRAALSNKAQAHEQVVDQEDLNKRKLKALAKEMNDLIAGQSAFKSLQGTLDLLNSQLS